MNLLKKNQTPHVSNVYNVSKAVKIIYLAMLTVFVAACSDDDDTTSNPDDETDPTLGYIVPEGLVTLEFVDIPATGDVPTFQMSTTEITNEMFKNYLNEALAQGLVTMSPALDPFGVANEGRIVFETSTGNPIINLSGSRVVKDHNQDGTYTVQEMENPINRCYIDFDGSQFTVVDPSTVNWEQYFDPSLYPNVVDSIDDWAELNEAENGRFSYADTDKKLPTLDEVRNWPVTYARYFGADAFAKFYGYDIATQAQWRVAAKAGQNFVYATNDGLTGNSDFSFNAWFDETEAAWIMGAPVPPNHVQHVKGVEPNPYGLYSMGGNVYEWSADWYEPDPNFPADPFLNTTGVQFVDGEDGREPILLSDIRIDQTQPLSPNNMYMKSGIGGAHNFPSRAMKLDAWNPHPFLQYANDHFGFRVIKNE